MKDKKDKKEQIDKIDNIVAVLIKKMQKRIIKKQEIVQ